MRPAVKRSRMMRVLTNRRVLGAAALAVLAIPLSISAGADVRRLTLGANRPAYEPVPMFPMTYEQLAAGPAFPVSRAPESSMVTAPMPRPAATQPRAHVAEAPPIRVLPSPQHAEIGRAHV